MQKLHVSLFACKNEMGMLQWFGAIAKKELEVRRYRWDYPLAKQFILHSCNKCPQSQNQSTPFCNPSALPLLVPRVCLAEDK